MAERRYVLSIAGIDPSAGAGLLADIKTLEMLEVYGLGIPTANTIQTDTKFFTNQWLSESWILDGVRAMLENYHVRAVKIGIIESSSLLFSVTSMIKRMDSNIPVVWDPVFKSSSNFNFHEDWQRDDMILKNIDVVTPNKNEWEILKKWKFPENIAVVVKGGHDEHKKGVDLLLVNGIETEIPPQTDNIITSKHGSGCVFSSALAGYLALGENITDACTKAKTYTEEFLASNNTLIGYHYGKTALHIAG